MTPITFACEETLNMAPTEIANQMNMLQSGLASAQRVFDFQSCPVFELFPFPFTAIICHPLYCGLGFQPGPIPAAAFQTAAYSLGIVEYGPRAVKRNLSIGPINDCYQPEDL